MGLPWRDGRLFLADPPDLMELTDTNGDRRADKLGRKFAEAASSVMPMRWPWMVPE